MQSAKLTPAACTRMRFSPSFAIGSAASSIRRRSYPPARWTTTFFTSLLERDFERLAPVALETLRNRLEERDELARPVRPSLAEWLEVARDLLKLCATVRRKLEEIAELIEERLLLV